MSQLCPNYSHRSSKSKDKLSIEISLVECCNGSKIQQGRAPQKCSFAKRINGANRTRTGGFYNAIVTLYQLSYSPF
jgi:hypothetical protein